MNLRLALQRLRSTLPQGQTLPDDVWRRRHRALVWLLWSQVVAVGLHALLRDYGLSHTLLHVSPLVGLASLATVWPRRRAGSTMVSLGLLTAAALMVHSSGGVIEAHFYFFVVIVLLTLYEDWIPFMAAVAYVVIHHGVIGVIDPSAVYNHPDAFGNPWGWAAIHGGFVLAAGIAGVISWRLNEDVRGELGRAFSKARQEIAERVRAEEEAERALSLLRATLESTADGILVVDSESNIVSYNCEFARMWRMPEAIMAAGDDAAAIQFVTRQLADPDAFVRKVQELYEHPEAESYDVLEFTDDRVFERYSRPQMIGGTSVGRVWSFRDITDRSRLEGELRELAEHDGLTGLYNRRRFEQEIEREVVTAARHGEEGALMVLDLDNFKYVNDTLGHQAGDQIITSVGSLLRGRLRETDSVARLGGDEFAVLLPRTGAKEATAVATELLQEIRKSGAVAGGRAVRVTTSLGIAMFGSDPVTGDELLSAADVAMYEAKDAGRDRIMVYDRNSREDGGEAGMRERMPWINRIRRALEDDRFTLYAQPILDLQSGEVSQHELLLRMQGESGEIIAPNAFLGIAERFGLVQSIDRWVIREAFALMNRELRAGNELRLEVNLSGRSVDDPELPRLIESELADSDIDPGNLILEITETTLISNMDEARRLAESLAATGCRFALDDFGAGFGSYYYLKHLPLDYLKIDGDFIRKLTQSSTDQLMVRAMVQVAQGLGMKTIAEFVGDEETVTLLREEGVGFAQGHHIGRPRPISEIWPHNELAEEALRALEPHRPAGAPAVDPAA